MQSRCSTGQEVFPFCQGVAQAKRCSHAVKVYVKCWFAGDPGEDPSRSVGGGDPDDGGCCVC